MRSLATLLTLPFAASGILSATPRIEQISPNPDITASSYRFADVDGNGFEDIVGDAPRGYSGGIPFLIRNLGNRTFATPEQAFYLQAGESPDNDFTLIELTGPGDFQMLVNSGYSDEYTPLTLPFVIPLDQPGTFGERTPLDSERTWGWIAVDLDGDHRSEFIHVQSAPDQKTELTIRDRQPDGTYSATVIILDEEFRVNKATAADLDDDGDLDLVLNGNDVIRVLRRSAHRSFESQVLVLPKHLSEITDLDGDGLLDFHSSSYSFEWKINLGDFDFGSIQSHQISPGNEYYEYLSAIPRPGESALLQFEDRKSESLSLKSVRFGDWQIDSDHTIGLSSLKAPTGSQSYDFFALQDLDKDGHPDLAFLVFDHINEASYNRLAVAWGTADGFESPVYTHPAPISFRQVIVADFDMQAGPDFIAGPDVEGRYWHFANDGTGKFNAPVKIDALDLPAGCPPETRISDIGHADFNNDGILDLAIRYLREVTVSYRFYSQSFCVIATGVGDGTFTNPTLPPGAFDTLVNERGGLDHIVDWDGDGDLDIIGNGEWRENIDGVLSSESMPLIDGASFSDILGNPVTRVHTRVGDIDGDGHPDIVSLAYRLTDKKIEGGIVGGLGSDLESVMAVGFNDGYGGIEEIAEIPVNLHLMDLLGNPVILDLSIADVNGDGRADICHQQSAGMDIFGNTVVTSKWRRNPGGAASRNPSLWISLPYGSLDLPDTPNPQHDFDGDGRKDWATPYGYVRPGPSGPVVSPKYDFTGNARFDTYGSTVWHVADFDGDGDTDALHTDRQMHLSLVRNPLVDERSPITRHLVAAGSTGQKAQPLSDADGDGRDNQTELLFGTDPLSKDNTPANPLGVHLNPGGSGNALRFQLPDYASELGLHYDVEHSTNLVDWAPLEGVSPDFISNNAGWNRMNLPLECSGPCGYFRIRGSHRTE